MAGMHAIKDADGYAIALIAHVAILSQQQG
jgi:hypothetical protein